MEIDFEFISTNNRIAEYHEVISNVKKKMEELSKDLPTGVKYNPGINKK